MGVTVLDEGVIFRFWAPHAERVTVIGEFNGWDLNAHPMIKDGNGVFSVEVYGARPGQKYNYHVTHAGASFDKPDPRALQLVNSLGPGIIFDPHKHTWQTNGFKASPPDEAVMYELHLGAFNAIGGHIGGWWTAMQKLDYLASLGINTIEVMPVAEFQGDYSEGYNPSFPFAPESAYGPPDDMMNFIDAAHARGIAVVLDVVHNHYGPSDLSMYCIDGDCLGAYGPYFYTDGRKDTPWGPRPNFGLDPVRSFIIDNAFLWMGQYHLDGLRWDSTINIRAATSEAPNGNGWSLLSAVNQQVALAFPQAMAIAEDFRDDAQVTDSVSNGGLGFTSQWDAEFCHPVTASLIALTDNFRDMNAIAPAIGHQFNNSSTTRVIYTESHDEVSNGRTRMPEMIWPGHSDSYFARKRSTLGAGLMLTSPGIPMLFMGQEFLENQYFAPQNALDWSKPGRYPGIVALYTDLIHLRRDWFANTAGLRGFGLNVHHINNQSKVIGYHRWQYHGQGDDVLVVANFSGQAFPSYRLGAPSGGAWHIRFNSDSKKYSSDFGSGDGGTITAVGQVQDGYNYSLTLALPPYSLLILSQ